MNREKLDYNKGIKLREERMLSSLEMKDEQ
jgi:hypothetical protein